MENDKRKERKKLGMVDKWIKGKEGRREGKNVYQAVED